MVSIMILTKHAMIRMEERNISKDDVMNIIQYGDIKSCKLDKLEIIKDNLGAVITDEYEPEVITVFWI